jgi:hypothetical protein
MSLVQATRSSLLYVMIIPTHDRKVDSAKASPRFSREEADVLACGDLAEAVDKGVIEDLEPLAYRSRAFDP